MESSLRMKGLAVNSFSSSKLQSQGFAGPLFRLQDFELECRRLAGQRFANVILDAARVQLAPAFDVSSGAQTKTEISLVGPIDLIVSATLAGTGVVGYLVMLEAGPLQSIECMKVHG